MYNIIKIKFKILRAMVPFLPLYTVNVKLPLFYFLFYPFDSSSLSWTNSNGDDSLSSLHNIPITLFSKPHHPPFSQPPYLSTPQFNRYTFCPFLPARTKNLLLWILALRLYKLNVLPPLIPESPCFLPMTFWSLVPPKVSFFLKLMSYDCVFFFLNGFFVVLLC